MSERVSLRDPEFNARKPSHTITRTWISNPESGQIYGQNRDSDTISRNYWENSIKASEYLSRLDGLGVLDSCLESDDQFKQLLVKLHVILSKGLQRNSPYGGQTVGDHLLIPGWQDRLRSVDFKVVARVSPESLATIQEYCQEFDAKHFNTPANHLKGVANQSITQDQQVYNHVYDVFVPESLFFYPPLYGEVLNQTLREVFIPTTPTCKDRSSVVVFIVNKSLPGEPETEQSAQIAYPSARYIDSYLSTMRAEFNKLTKADSLEQQQQHLSQGYYAGIRSQAFETVWNSELMTMVNYFLTTKLGLKPVSHGGLDIFALFLSKQPFNRFFAEFVAKFN